MNVDAIRSRLDELAGDVGRLRGRFEPGTWDGFMADRIAGHVESLVLMVEPTAGELVAWNAPGSDEAVDAALEIVDGRWEALRARIGGPAA